MSLGYFLILAVLILGGIIATLGDRIGTKVGKARLSLFNLRPKKTAVLITILTGILISASTMGLLLLVSRGVRDRLLNFEDILRNRRKDLEKTQADLDQVGQDKTKVQDELVRVREERLRVKEQLDRLNQSLKGAVARQRQTEGLRQQVESQRNQIQLQFLRVSGQAAMLRSDIGQLQRDRQILLEQRNRIASQITQRDQEIAQQESALAKQDQELAQRDQDISARDQVISQREKRLQELEQQAVILQSDLEQLAQSEQLLRVGVPAIVRNQTLAFGVVQANNVEEARSAVDTMLLQANRVAVNRIQPGTNGSTQIVQIEPAEVDRLLARLSDAQSYVVRVLSTANYLLGETFDERRGVRVIVEVTPNRTIFNAGDVVASQVLETPSRRSSPELQDWITELINEANFRARRRGILADTSNVRYPSVQAVVAQLRQSDSSIEVRVIAAEEAPAAGPLKLEFVVIQDGKVLLQTQS